jgi:sphingomyelin phosphodiesterase
VSALLAAAARLKNLESTHCSVNTFMPLQSNSNIFPFVFTAISFVGALLGYWMILKHTPLATVVFWSPAGAQRPVQGSPEALNPSPTNIIAQDVITLYYNGTGSVPAYDEVSPGPEPITPLTEAAISKSVVSELLAILETPFYADSCSKCIATTQILHVTAISQSASVFTSTLIAACESAPVLRSQIRAASCQSQLSQYGPYLAQLFAKMSLATGDMHHWCSVHYGFCEEALPILIDESLYFTPKPEAANVAPAPSAQTINVLHLSDWHLDPRYDIGSEGNCSDYLCCRPYSINIELDTTSANASLPASRFGSFMCDTPADLALSAFTDMPQFIDMHDLDFTIFTGDIVSHDAADLISQAYVSYVEATTFKVLKRMLDDTPVYTALGNHDSQPVGFNTPHVMDPNPSNSSSNVLQWNYDLVSSLWSGHSWLNDTEAEFARSHYGAYATTTSGGLRIISLNGDFWYRENIFNYFNVTNPDPSGMLKWMADELSECEKRGQRAWVIAHVLTGYDGTAPMPNPTAL